MKALIDTCVILDYLQGREPYFDDALNTIIGVANNEFEGYITASSMTDLYYIIHKNNHSHVDSHRILSKLTELVDILDTSAEDCLKAIRIGSDDFEDAVMMETANRNKMDYIITRNGKDYVYSRVPAVDPRSFLQLL